VKSPLDAKQKIFIATLQIIRNQGMRAVRHRAVAEAAGVSLGSTTYHFKTLTDLIAGAFMYWLDRDNSNRGPQLKAIEQTVLSVKKDDINHMSALIIQGANDYLRTQILDNRDDRFIELAFHNEALQNPELSELLLQVWQTDVDQLANLFTALGSTAAEADAENTLAVILHLERKSLLYKDEDLPEEFPHMCRALARHVETILQRITR
jgi:DNA-binding transcriptional regulator YbjK